MKSKFDYDFKLEPIVSEWLEENLFLREPGVEYKRNTDVNLQYQGVDFMLRSQNLFETNDYKCIDEKAATDYINTTLKTFAFELGSYNKDDEWVDGWLFGERYSKTEYYLLSWIWAKSNIFYKDGRVKRNLLKEGIIKIESYLINKRSLHKAIRYLHIGPENVQAICNYLNEGNKLKSVQKPIREEYKKRFFNNVLNKEYNKTHKNYFKIVKSGNKKESPINLLINKEVLKFLAIKTWETANQKS